MRRGTAAVAALAAVALSACGSAAPGGTGAGSLPLDGRSPLVPPAKTVRVLVQLRRPSLADQMNVQPYAPGRQRAYVSSLGDEVAALQSSLRAKGVKLGDPVLFARAWNGFAATVRARDLPRIQSLGLRTEPVRRFYGAGASDGGTPAAATSGASAPRDGEPTVALLDTGVDAHAPGLGGHIVPGRDAVDHDGDPKPAGSAERHGTQVARVLAAALGRAGGPVLSIRVAGLRRDPQSRARAEYGTTDELLEGLERAVDPNGDGDVTDHLPVALVGVNSPYAGFGDTPEAEAVAGATTLGTLVVAPAGNEGRRSGPLGTIGSPGAAPEALTAGALEGGGGPGLPAVDLGLATGEGRMRATAALLGGERASPLRAPVTGLAGPSQAKPKERGRALGGSPLEYFRVDATPRARGRVAVVPARAGPGRPPSLAERAAAASEARAAALVVCEPDPARPLPALPDGSTAIPVLALRGDPARRALDLTAGGGGGLAFLSSARERTDRGRIGPGVSSSQGPTYALGQKPDVAAAGTARLGPEVVAGTSVAAARVAAAAAAVRRARPRAGPDEVAARLVESAAPRGPLLGGGAGEPSPARAIAATVVVDPAIVALPRQDPGGGFTARADVAVRNTGKETTTVTPRASMPGVRVSTEPVRMRLPAGQTEALTVIASAAGRGRPPGYLAGTLRLGPATARLALPVEPPPAAPMSPLALLTDAGRTSGVRFSAGAVRTAGTARDVEPIGDLRLEVIDAGGSVVRELTPQGGARDLLPGEYAYTLTKDAMNALKAGPFRFRATAHGPAGGRATVRTSPSFETK